MMIAQRLSLYSKGKIIPVLGEIAIIEFSLIYGWIYSFKGFENDFWCEKRIIQILSGR